MANLNLREPNNITSNWYVDTTCTHCHKCTRTCSAVFYGNENATWVFAGPHTPEDLALCEKAMAECPVGAIGNDWVEP